MNETLTKLKRMLNANSEEISLPPYLLWTNGSFYHLTIRSCGCSYHKRGYCTVCDYGSGKRVTEEEIDVIFNSVFNNIDTSSIDLLVGSFGSLLDAAEIPTSVLLCILKNISYRHFRTLTIETHYETINEKRLKLIQTTVGNSVDSIMVELGFESANPFVLENCFNKKMDLSELERKMDLISLFGMQPILNIFLGAPFLTQREMLEDAVDSLNWAKNHKAYKVVVFPSNIKPNTVSNYLYERGLYSPPSLWLLLEFLDAISEEDLSMVELAWYGARQSQGNSLYAIPPRTCDKCRGILLNGLNDFCKFESFTERRKIIDNLIALQNICHCSDAHNENTVDNDMQSRILNQIAIIREEIQKHES